MNAIEQKKYQIISRVVTSQQEQLLDSLWKLIEDFVSSSNFKLDLSKHSNLQSSINLEEIKKEKPVSKSSIENFIQKAERMEWKKSTAQLLSELD